MLRAREDQMMEDKLGKSGVVTITCFLAFYAKNQNATLAKASRHCFEVDWCIRKNLYSRPCDSPRLKSRVQEFYFKSVVTRSRPITVRIEPADRLWWSLGTCRRVSTPPLYAPFLLLKTWLILPFSYLPH